MSSPDKSSGIIHKFSCRLKKFKSFMEMKLVYIFVDEVSMLHSNFYKILMIIKKLKRVNLLFPKILTN